jgi:hypothetical protein
VGLKGAAPSGKKTRRAGRHGEKAVGGHEDVAGEEGVVVRRRETYVLVM